jgi:DNA-binding Lrp family transcriptional regulator
MPAEIDTVNAIILKELLKDGRKSFTEIAKECDTSKDVIAKRYKKMESKGIIVGTTIQNSPACYDGHFIAAIDIDVEPQKVEEILSLAYKIPKVIQVFRTGYNPSLSLWVVLRKMEELEQIKQSIKRLPFLLRVDIRVWIGIRTTPENLSILKELCNDKEGNENSLPTQKNVETKIDDVDKAMIEKLAVDGRMPFEKIAKEIEVSTDTVIRRYEKLRRSGDLKVVAQINPTKIGYHAFAIFNVAFSQESLPENIIQVLSRIPNINMIIKTSGSFDYVISLLIRDIQQFVATQEIISSIPGVTSMKTGVGKMFERWPIPREFISSF